MRNEFINDSFFSGIRQCARCSLCDIQKPLLDISHQADVMWVGLSAVRVDDVMTARPLSSDTRSGGLVEEIESRLPNLSFYRTNLVKCLPESNGKIRYPTIAEMKSCMPNLASEIKVLSPKIVLLLGKKVAEQFLKQKGFGNFTFDEEYNYDEYVIGDTTYVPVHHPSFILVYKRRNIESYIGQVSKIISKNFPNIEIKLVKRTWIANNVNENIVEQLSLL
ncbi:MAG: uracil-DNA glycosylase family protein [bacterium]|nr:uracil-DNA glycosylase family protein [bacterium]